MYIPREERYQDMVYRRCGHSGLKLPAISLGLWHNFGAITPFEPVSYRHLDVYKRQML